jgi:hypothetical protein
MNETVVTTVMITGFGIAFFPAAIPTHWLPTSFKFIIRLCNSKRRDDECRLVLDEKI